MEQLGKNVKVVKLAATQSGAGTDYSGSDSVDTQGYEGVMFLASLGTAANDNGIKAQQSSDDGSSDGYSDLEGTQVLSDGTQTDLALTIHKPRKRYLKPIIVRGTSTTIEAVWAVLYGAHKLPVTNTTAAQAAEEHTSPAEGTA